MMSASARVSGAGLVSSAWTLAISLRLALPIKLPSITAANSRPRRLPQSMERQAEPNRHGSAEDPRKANEGEYGRLYLAKHFGSSFSAGLI